MAEGFASPPEARDSSPVSSEQNEITQPLSEQGTMNGENLIAMEGVTVSDSLKSTVIAETPGCFEAEDKQSPQEHLSLTHVHYMPGGSPTATTGASALTVNGSLHEGRLSKTTVSEAELLTKAMPVLHSAETAKDNITETETEEVAKAKTNETDHKTENAETSSSQDDSCALTFQSKLPEDSSVDFLVSSREEPASFEGNCYGVAGQNVDHGQRENDLCTSMPEKSEVEDEYVHTKTKPPNNSRWTDRLDSRTGGASSKSKQTTVCRIKSGILRPRGQQIGFCPLSDDFGISVTFHVLLRKDAWKWNGRNMRICMRFGDHRLGGGLIDVGEFQSREIGGEEFLEMYCKLKFDILLLTDEKPLTYMYLIHDLDNNEELLECLHHVPSHETADVNRCLVIPTTKCNPHGHYHQYDNMVHPKMRSRSFSRKLMGIVRKTPRDEYSIPNYDLMQEKCLLLYLKMYYNLLSDCKLKSHLNVVDTAAEIVLLYNQLFQQTIALNGESFETPRIAKKLPEVFKKWLLDIIDKLQLLPVESPCDNGRRMASVLCIIYCLHLNIEMPGRFDMGTFSTPAIESLLSMLLLRPYIADRVCTDLDIVLTTIPKWSFASVSRALIFICTHFSYKRHLKSPQWLFAVPLVHFFLEYNLSPFDELEVDLDKIRWSDEHFELSHIPHLCKHRNSGFIERYFDQLMPLFELDSLLLPMVVSICPKLELRALFGKIPPFLAIAWFAKYLEESVEVLSKKDVIYFAELIETIFEVAENNLNSTSKCDILSSTIKASQSLVEHLFPRLPEIDPHTIRVVIVSVRLILYVACLLRCSDDVYVQQALGTVHGIGHCLRNHIAKYSRVYGSPKLSVKNPKFKNATNELELFDSLVTINPVDAEIQEILKNDVLQLLQQRVISVPVQMAVEMFCTLETVKDVHHFIVNIFEDRTFNALIDPDMTECDEADAIETLYKNTKAYRKTVGSILDKILAVRYHSSRPEAMSLEELLMWFLWPQYIIVFKLEQILLKKTRKALHPCLSESTSSLCYEASGVLDVVCSKLCDRSILMQELHTISQCLNQMEKLCKVAAYSSWGKEHFVKALHCRLLEYNFFVSHRQPLIYLCSQVTVRVEGLNELQEELARNYDSSPVADICNTGCSMFLCFEAATPLISIAKAFYTVAFLRGNVLFDDIWKQNMTTASRNNPELTIQSIVSDMWAPTVSDCTSLLDGIKHQSIQLAEIDKHFANNAVYRNDESLIKDHIHRLYLGLRPDQMNLDLPSSLLSAVELIVRYISLSKCSSTALVVLDLREKLQLSGDFELIETISKKTGELMQDQSLRSVAKTRDEGEEFLLEVISDDHKFNCLQSLSQCMDLVQWVRTVTMDTGPEELDAFVNVALHTAAGEDDFHCDILSNLRRVCSAFGPLIYRARCFTSFCDGCRSVWVKLASNPGLSAELVDCNQNLAWYKSIWGSQASIDSTSYTLMDKILECGSYKVGNEERKVFGNLDEVVLMHLTVNKDDITNTADLKAMYSLGELRDLESKLVLITGSQAENREKVDNFLNLLHNVCHIAETLILLQQAGNVKYIGWKLELQACSIQSTCISVLKEIATSLQDEITKWEEEMEIMRDQFYELNYYTTLQLLTLRKQLALQKTNNRGTFLNSSILTLLQSVSRNVDSRIVNSTLTELKLSTPTCVANNEQKIANSRLELVGDRPVISIYCDQEAEKQYLSIRELGILLRELRRCISPVLPRQRPFNSLFKVGYPNLIITSPGTVLQTVLSLYMEDKSLPLPTKEEVLICNQETTIEELTILWRRAIRDVKGFKHIYCLVGAERLPYQLFDKALQSLRALTHAGTADYRLVIICSNEGEAKSHILSKLQDYRVPFGHLYDISQCQRYLKFHFTNVVTQHDTTSTHFPASFVDFEDSCVRVVRSDRPGMGKSLYIKRLGDQLQKQTAKNATDNVVTISILSSNVTPELVLNFLLKQPLCTSCIYHLDIAPDAIGQIDTILFSLLILHGLSDNKGRIWRSHPSQLFAIEVTTTDSLVGVTDAEHSLGFIDLIPTVRCDSPKKSIDAMKRKGAETTNDIVMDMLEYQSTSYQRVYQYLDQCLRNMNLDNFVFNAKNITGDPVHCLQTILHYCGLKDPSWSEINHFIKFLDVQLQSCELSVFCDSKLTGDIFSGLKGFVVKFMIRMSRDFATSSLTGEVAREDPHAEHVPQHDLAQYQIASRKGWEHSTHPYIFFNQDRVSITFVGFQVTSNGDLMDPTNGTLLERAIMTSQLYSGLKLNKVDFEENYHKWSKAQMLEKIAAVMGIHYAGVDPDESYVLTADNMIKILAIQMRFRCGIPVVIMGETGCGKTKLIRYMCALARQGKDYENMLTLKVHGGTKECDIVRIVERAEEVATRNMRLSKEQNISVIVFFDEANTTDAIGRIKEIMCDRRLCGKPITDNLKFIAACNPYKQHSQEMIQKLENAGLGFYVRVSETKDKLGKLPLRQLVYRVFDLPPSMRPLVYDFGQLNNSTEERYIKHIVTGYIKKHPDLSRKHRIDTAISRVLTWSQQYMKRRQDECSFVSLRDVKRVMNVFKYFYDKMNIFAPLINGWVSHHYWENPRKRECHSIDPATRALILSISVCYHARLQDREEFEIGICAAFSSPLTLHGGDEQFRNEIKWCQEAILDSMRLGENIARNAALRENVFMMTICIELKIPLFLVGKPGSSKSLAKAIIRSSMHGQASHNKVLREFKEAQMFSYQCSQLSTSQSVIDVFNTAKKCQEKQDVNQYVAVVVLDEVGLAEDSPNLPLKALHPLLEDGTDSDNNQVIVAQEERVAFIGISNWALDPAKMNRGVMVTRGDPSDIELELSARSICSNKENDPIREQLEIFFRPLARGYMEICRKQKKEFFGLRDFYCLIKMLYWMCKKSEGRPLTWPQLEHAIKRNFGGLSSDELDPLEEFGSKIPLSRIPSQLSLHAPHLHSILNPDCSSFGLIRASLSTKDKTWHGENRYLLFLTESYAALDILKHFLNVETYSTEETGGSSMEPFILFGSSFPKDKDYTQVCRNINQIKICMETGRTVILLNLDNLYESLYDALNQYYVHTCGNRYVDLGLQTHRVKCRIHDDFKLILIAEKDTVYQKFPIPLINRLEKHFVLISSILEEWQGDVVKVLEEWVKDFAMIRDSNFKERDAFIGYQTDTPAAVVFQATNQLRKLKEEHPTSWHKLDSIKKYGVFKGVIWNQVLTLQEDTYEWKEAVLQLSKCLLLQMAVPDAIVRLNGSRLKQDSRIEIQRQFFGEQKSKSIEDFLICNTLQEDTFQHAQLMQVTTHSHLMSHEELHMIGYSLSIEVTDFFLTDFDTDIDFCNKISEAFGDKGSPRSKLVVIQCDLSNPKVNCDLIACARHRIYDTRVQLETKNIVHVLFIVHFPYCERNSSFVGFPWIAAHVDDLRPASVGGLTPLACIGVPLSELFIGKLNAERLKTTSDPKTGETIDSKEQSVSQSIEKGSSIVEGVTKPAVNPFQWPFSHSSNSAEGPTHTNFPPQYARLYDCIQSAASKLQDVDCPVKRVETLSTLIPKEVPEELEEKLFCGTLIKYIFGLLVERERLGLDDSNWVLKEAMNARKLQNGGTFRKVLARRIDEVIIPIFAKIISVIDRNSNLSLLNPLDQSEPLSKLWLSMFRESRLMPFSSEEMFTDKEQGVSVSRTSEHGFKSKLPFSWIIKETVDSQWEAARSVGGDDQLLHSRLCVLVQYTLVGEILLTVTEENGENFYRYYLHDFVRRVHRCLVHGSSEMEYEVIAEALNVVVCGSKFNSLNGNSKLIGRIASLHIVYHSNKTKLMWFSQVVSYKPDILLTLIGTQWNTNNDVEIHLLVIQNYFEEILADFKKDSRDKNFRKWLNNICLTQNTISSILSMHCTQSELGHRLRIKWQHLQALRMFTEHILLNHNIPLSYMKLFVQDFHDELNFFKESTLLKLKNHLHHIISDLKGKCPGIRESCDDFFMEVVSTLCFGGDQQPEPEVFQMLMDTVIESITAADSNVSKTSSLRSLLQWFTGATHDSIKDTNVSVIQSFLLQLLLQYDCEQAKMCFSQHTRSQQTADKSVDQGLCLVFVQCFEDKLSREGTEFPFCQQLKRALLCLEQGYIALQKQSEQQVITSDFLEGIAKVRFALQIVAELVNLQINQTTSTESNGAIVTHYNSELLQIARKVCLDPQINCSIAQRDKDTGGPQLFLVKILVRQYGLPCLKKSIEMYPWIIPQNLLSIADEERSMDPFVIYGSLYQALREAVSIAVYAKSIVELRRIAQELQSHENSLLLLVFYEKVTLCRASRLPMQIDVLQLNSFIEKLAFHLPADRDSKHIARKLIANQQGGSLLQMTVKPNQPLHLRMLVPVVVHVVSVLSCKKESTTLLPFTNMLTNPFSLKDSYLPTMPEDSTVEVVDALKATSTYGKLYVCPNGHRYFIGECGRACERAVCNECGAKIGGQSHVSEEGNTLVSVKDTSKTGHVLGDSATHSVTNPERSLSRVVVCILRALMHSAFLWACCNSERALVDISHLVKPNVRPNQLPEFFWRHFEKDIELLGLATGKGLDETVIILHLVLKEMLTRSSANQIDRSVCALKTKQHRSNWEDVFNRLYIQPVLTGLEQNISKALESVFNDDQQEQNLLFNLSYEQIKVTEGSLEPHLWIFRSRITLEHLERTIQTKEMREKHPILYEFLKAERKLRATQYLVDIVQLQQMLYVKFHNCFDKQIAKTQTIGEFLKGITQLESEHTASEGFKSLQIAWSLVAPELKTHSRLNDKYLMSHITDDTPLEYFVPTSTEAVSCISALVDFLIRTHNDFIERCRSIVDSTHRSASYLTKHWRNSVPISCIQKCHLVDYERQVLPILFSHCQYSLMFGKGQNIEYDCEALEKHILDRFVFGKPLISFDIAQVVYFGDTHTHSNFANIRNKVRPQKQIPLRLQQAILAELQSPDKLRESLDVVDIVLGFLSCGGGKAETSLKEYIDNVLKMETRPFSKQAKEVCTLSHVISLWEILSTELAKLLFLSGKEPFELGEQFHKDLSSEEKSALDTCLRFFDHNRLLCTLYVFIETFVTDAINEPQRFDWDIVNTLEAYLDENELPEIPQFSETFPSTITLSQAVATWKYTATFAAAKLS